MPHDIAPFLTALDGDLAPIRHVAERLADATIDARTGAVLLSPTPAIAPEAFACVLFPGVTPDAILQYELFQRSTNCQVFEIPEVYKRVLFRLNGAIVFGLNLFGLPATMRQAPPLLDRSARQPLDVGAANSSWRRRYAPRPSQFQFGSGQYSYEENTAYFLDEDGSVDALIRGGRRVWNWPSFEPFLAAELARSEALFKAGQQGIS